MSAIVGRKQLHQAGLRDLPPTGAGVLRGGKPLRQVGGSQDRRAAANRQAPGKLKH